MVTFSFNKIPSTFKGTNEPAVFNFQKKAKISRPVESLTLENFQVPTKLVLLKVQVEGVLVVVSSFLQPTKVAIVNTIVANKIVFFICLFDFKINNLILNIFYNILSKSLSLSSDLLRFHLPVVFDVSALN